MKKWTIISAYLTFVVLVVSYFFNLEKYTNYIETSRLIVSIIMLVVGIFSLIYFALLTRRYGQKRRYYSWFALFVICFLRTIAYSLKLHVPNSMYFYIHTLCMGVAIYLLGVGVLMFLATLKKCPKNVDYIIIHGSRVGGRVLKGRINMAYKYLKRNENTIAIGTGEQGFDEKIPEGTYIKKKLVEKGIDPKRVLVEDTSTSTIENIKNAAKLMKDYKDKKIAVVSDDWHVFRCKKTVKRFLGVEAYSICSYTYILSSIDSIARELFVNVYHFFKGDIK